MIEYYNVANIMITKNISKKNMEKKTIAVYITVIFIIGAFTPSVISDPTDYWFGFNTQWTASQPLDNTIRGIIATLTYSGTAESISAYLKKSSGTTGTWNINCSLYYASNNTFLAATTGRNIDLTKSWTWYTFDFPNPKPVITAGESYYILAFANDAAGTVNAQIAFGSSPGNTQYYKTDQTYPLWPSTITGFTTLNNYAISIYCSYTVTSTNRPPVISGNIPLNGSTNIPLHPTVSVYIEDQDGDNIHCDWYISNNGVDWIWKQSNDTINSSIFYYYNDASDYSTTYYWKVTANDGTFNVSNIYYFITQSNINNWFGFNTQWTASQPLDNTIRGIIATPTYSGTAESISAYLKKSSGTTGTWNINCSLYYASNNTFLAATTGRNIDLTKSWTWYTFDFPNPKPVITAGESYYILAFANDAAGTVNAQIAFGSSPGNTQYYKTDQTYPLWPSTITGFTTLNNYAISIYCSYSTSLVNNSPIISSPNPSNGMSNVPISLSELTFSLVDLEGDLMNYTVETSPSIGSKNENNIGNGTKTIPISNLEYSKTYYWFVNATDPNGSGNWTKKTYSFTTVENTENAEPVISNPYPHNQEAPYNPRLTVSVYDPDNDPLTVVFRTNASGTWTTLGTYTGGNKVYTQDAVGMNTKNKTYYWSVNVFDGAVWVNKTYYFTAQAFVLKWSNNINVNTKRSPLASDVDRDGIYEVFVIGDNHIWCLNGSTGVLRWRYDNDLLGYDNQMEIGDLNNDGIEELVASAKSRTIALHANNGTVYWNVKVESSNKNIVIADIEGNKYPYVYIASDNITQGENGTGRVRKLRGTDGTVLAEAFIFRPCYGSLSFADSDNDGKFELYSTDRSYTLGNPSAGRGMICFDADTLKILWYCDMVTCSSHCQILVDVNNDGILDSVAMQEGYPVGDIYVIDGKTWDKMIGKPWGVPENLTAHSQPSVYDIDNDGNLELITCSGDVPKVWDLGSWTLENTSLASAAEPPKMGNVIGDQNLEIINTRHITSSSIYIYNNLFQLVETIPTSAQAHTLIQDLDKNGRNELVLISGDGSIKVYETSGVAPEKLPRTNSQFFSERRTAAAVYIPPPGAPQPIIKEISPLNNSQDVQFNPILSARVIDFHYDLMNITISTNASGSWTNVATFNNVGNGWYNYTPTNMDQPSKTYYWRVTAVDPYADNIVTSETYSFTTNTPPQITNIIATPSVISPGQYVNISCNVIDNSLVNVVKVNVTYPDGNTTMNLTASGGNAEWELLAYDDFETGWGNYTDGGTECYLYSGNNSYQGNNSALIQNFWDLDSSFILTQSVDVDTPRYTSLKIDFWFKAQNLRDRENLWIKYYDGKNWRLVLDLLAGRDFVNDQFYHITTWINETDYNFPKDMKIRFQCDASNSNDQIYIDQVSIYATKAQGPKYYLNNSYTQEGIYQYFIWASDTNGNSITSNVQTFEVKI